jgi:hypothetical protein
MIVGVDGIRYKVVFWHSPYVHGAVNKSGFRQRRVTKCEIYRERGIGDEDKPPIQRLEWEIWRVGVAVCCPSDQFCRETGRKLALGRALKGGPRVRGRAYVHTGMTREMRREFWKGYHSRVGGLGVLG